MHHFIYPKQDSWISSGSNHIDDESYKAQNFGQDQILELKKEFWNKSFDYPTRILMKFDLDETKNSISKSIVDGDIKNPKFYLRLYEAEGNSELSLEYKLAAFPLSQSWSEGTGKFIDDPITNNGVSWENRSYPTNGTPVSWSVDAAHGNFRNSHGGNYLTRSTHRKSEVDIEASQSFNNESPDVDMDITNICNYWLKSGSNSNHGLLLRFSGSQETDSTTFGQLKFFSKDTYTIYSPKLEVRWDDHLPCTGSNTGSNLQITSSGLADNYLYTKRLRDKYKVGDRVKFRVGARKRYIQKTFNTSVQTVSQSYVPENSGSYSIVDVATGETIVPFEDSTYTSYTKLSCDINGNYFTQWLNGFETNRVYKILYKLKTDDGQERIFDNDDEFKVVN